MLLICRRSANLFSFKFVFYVSWLWGATSGRIHFLPCWAFWLLLLLFFIGQYFSRIAGFEQWTSAVVGVETSAIVGDCTWGKKAFVESSEAERAKIIDSALRPYPVAILVSFNDPSIASWHTSLYGYNMKPSAVQITTRRTTQPRIQQYSCGPNWNDVTWLLSFIFSSGSAMSENIWT